MPNDAISASILCFNLLLFGGLMFLTKNGVDVAEEFIFIVDCSV